MTQDRTHLPGASPSPDGAKMTPADPLRHGVTIGTADDGPAPLGADAHSADDWTDDQAVGRRGWYY
jgi:hypothetical protein